MKEELKIGGIVRAFQTNENGLIIPDTEVVLSNTIQDSLKNSLSYWIGDASVGTTPAYFDAQDPSTQGGRMGIAAVTSDDFLTYCFVTSLNAGADGVEEYIEYYGYIDGPVTLQNYLGIVSSVAANNTAPSTMWSKLSISEIEVLDNRRYHVYWKITIS